MFFVTVAQKYMTWLQRGVLVKLEQVQQVLLGSSQHGRGDFATATVVSPHAPHPSQKLFHVISLHFMTPCDITLLLPKVQHPPRMPHPTGVPLSMKKFMLNIL